MRGITLTMEALGNIYQAILCSIPEDSYLPICCHENLKSYLFLSYVGGW
jgi:hypothetical protein